jgi:hypothetical protein
MADPRPPYHRRSTRPLPRVELAPIAPAPPVPIVVVGEVDEAEPETQTPCPWCSRYGGRGLVPAEVRAEWMRAYPELHVADEETVVPPSRPL